MPYAKDFDPAFFDSDLEVYIPNKRELNSFDPTDDFLEIITHCGQTGTIGRLPVKVDGEDYILINTKHCSAKNSALVADKTLANKIIDAGKKGTIPIPNLSGGIL